MLEIILISYLQKMHLLSFVSRLILLIIGFTEITHLLPNK